MEDEIAELEERLQALKVARQELAEEVADQKCEEVCVTVSECSKCYVPDAGGYFQSDCTGG